MREALAVVLVTRQLDRQGVGISPELPCVSALSSKYTLAQTDHGGHTMQKHVLLNGGRAECQTQPAC